LPCSLRIQVHVSVRGYATHFHVIEETVNVPRFSRFCSVPENKEIPLPTSKVSFVVNENVSRVYAWLQSSFIIPARGGSGIKITSANDKLKAYFVAVCPPIVDVKVGVELGFQVLYIYASLQSGSSSSSSGGGSTGLKVDVFCDSMDLAAEIVQDIARFLNIDDLESEANFPAEMKLFEDILTQVADLNSDRQRLTADMAEDSQKVKV